MGGSSGDGWVMAVAAVVLDGKDDGTMVVRCLCPPRQRAADAVRNQICMIIVSYNDWQLW